MLFYSASTYWFEEDEHSFDELLDYLTVLSRNSCSVCEGEGDLKDDYGINTCYKCGGTGFKSIGK